MGSRKKDQVGNFQPTSTKEIRENLKRFYRNTNERIPAEKFDSVPKMEQRHRVTG